MLVRNDAQTDQLSEELDFSYSHDTLTGLANRSRYETDLRELPPSGYESMVCTYIDVVGMHEVNDHLGHRSGDTLLCFMANAARKFFAPAVCTASAVMNLSSSPQRSRPTACGAPWTRCVPS